MLRQEAILFLALIITALVHELAHVVVSYSLCVPVKRIGISWHGPYIVRERGTDWQCIAISLAGPVANLLTAVGCMLVFAYWRVSLSSLSMLWFLSLVLGTWNLLPLPASDGLRAYRIIFGLFNGSLKVRAA
jgi:Zn-dependent protease